MNKQSLIIWSFILLFLFIGIIRWGDYLIQNHYIIEEFDNNSFLNDPNISYNHTVNVPLTTTTTCQNLCGPPNRCHLTGEQCVSDVDCYGCYADDKKVVSNDSDGYNEDNTNLNSSKSDNIAQNISNFVYKNTGISQNDLAQNNLSNPTQNQNAIPGFSGSTMYCAISNSLTGNQLKNMTNYGDNGVRGQNDAGKLTTETTPTYSVLTTDIGTRAKLVNAPNTQPPQYFKGVDQWRETYDAGEVLFDKRYNPNSQKFTIKYPQRTTLSGEFVDNGPLAANAYL